MRRSRTNPTGLNDKDRRELLVLLAAANDDELRRTVDEFYASLSVAELIGAGEAMTTGQWRAGQAKLPADATAQVLQALFRAADAGDPPASAFLRDWRSPDGGSSAH